MASLLEKSANIFLIVACTVVVGQFGYRLIHKPARQGAVFSPGAQIRGTAALALNSAPRTLIMATSSTCSYCKASMPFYKQAADLARKTGTRIVAVSVETTLVNRAFLGSHGIAVDAVLLQSDSGVKVPHLPTLILVRGDGTIVNSWEGQPRDDATQRSVLKALGKS